MTEEKKYRTVIVEKDQEKAMQIGKLLEKRVYAPSILSTREEMIEQLGGKTIPLIILGETEDGYSPFQLMEEVVKRSPMTSTILLTDASEEEVEEKAEGYGILGHVGNAPGDGFFTLLDNFEKISGAL
ncbi:MAG TPA: hypothetical protein HPP58_02995, partial [Deltaproteobacteria bacterium]|nr:hypothetical protein [Deltaproteobacteria bacterium]